MLNLFICNVDEELLEGIMVKVFKAKDIENSNFKFLAPREQMIYVWNIINEKIKRHTNN